MEHPALGATHILSLLGMLLTPLPSALRRLEQLITCPWLPSGHAAHLPGVESVSLVANNLLGYGPMRMREEFGSYLQDVDTLPAPSNCYRYFRRDYTPADREMCLQELLGSGQVTSASIRGTPRIHKPALGEHRRSHSNLSSTRRQRVEDDRHGFLRLLADCDIPVIEDVPLGDVQHIGRSGRFAGTVSTTPGPDKVIASYLETRDMGMLECLNNL